MWQLRIRTRVWYKPNSMASHVHLVQRRLPIEQDEAITQVNEEQNSQALRVLTLHLLNGARQSICIEGKCLLVCCTEGQSIPQYISCFQVPRSIPHMLLQICNVEGVTNLIWASHRSKQRKTNLITPTSSSSVRTEKSKCLPIRFPQRCFFFLETCPDSFYSRPDLKSLRISCDVIVHVHSNVELKWIGFWRRTRRME